MYAILDIGLKPEAHRFLAFTPKAEPLAAKGIGRESTYAIDPQNGIPAIGAFSLLPGFINSGFGWVPSCLETEKGGVFTQSIIQMLKQLPRDGFKVNQLVTALKQENVPLENKAYLFPRVFGSENKRILKPDPSLESGMKPVEEFFLRRAKEVLSRFESSEPRALIELALVQHLLGDSEGAIRMLESFPVSFDSSYAWAHPYESAGSDKEKWSYAVSELRNRPM
ncbi:MAG: hypothetical protein IPK21_22920 [Haliscomenobacter sp.]|nr:hypothetical protein [Haliscomenobacter sp.]